MSILSDLYRRYSPVISQAVTMRVRLPSCPGHSRVCQGWRWRFRVTQASLVWILQFPKFSQSGNFFPGTGNFFRTRGNRVPLTSLIKFQLCYFSFYLSYYGDFSVSVPVSVVCVRNAMFDSQIKSTVKLIVRFQKRCWPVSCREMISLFCSEMTTDTENTFDIGL